MSEFDDIVGRAQELATKNNESWIVAKRSNVKDENGLHSDGCYLIQGAPSTLDAIAEELLADIVTRSNDNNEQAKETLYVIVGRVLKRLLNGDCGQQSMFN